MGYYKISSDIVARDSVLLQAMLEDVIENHSIVEANLKSILTELDVVKENKFIVEPLRIVRQSIFELIKVSPPNILTRSHKMLSAFRETAAVISNINEIIHSREQYRVLSIAAVKQMEWLEAYDETLVRLHTSLRSSLDLLRNELSQWLEH